MAQLFTNNGTSTLAAGITSGATSLTVATGHGARFPTPTSADYFLVTLEKPDGTREILKVTARSGDVLSGITRAQEGTTAVAFLTGHTVELRVTAETITNALVAPAQIYAGAMREIASVTTTGSQASVTFSAIPSTYKSLLLVSNSRGTNATNTISTTIQCNGDTGANYAHLRENRFGSAGSLTGTNMDLFAVPGSSATTLYHGEANIWFHDYTDITRHRSIMAQSTVLDGTSVIHQQAAGWWRNASAAISQLVIACGAGNWADGSRFTLYGIGGEVGGAALNPIYTKYDPFCPPVSPSSLDDEFTVDSSTTPAGWTLASGAGSALVRNGKCVMTSAANASYAPTVIEKVLPAGPFTILTHAELLGRSLYHNLGMTLRSTASGRAIDHRVYIGPSADSRIVNSTTVRLNSYTSEGTGFNDQGAYAPMMFLRICYDGTTIYFERSYDGTEFYTVYSEAMTAWFTSGNVPDRFGLHVEARNASNTHKGVFSFLRYAPVAFADLGRNIGVGSDGALVDQLPLLLHNQVI